MTTNKEGVIHVFESKEGRTLTKSQRVHVFYNLHKGGYSIKDKKTGLVVAYADTVRLENCVFRVQQGGRQKTIAEKRKRVHAIVEGDFLRAGRPEITRDMEKVYYNPYTTEEFTSTVTGQHVFQSETVVFADKVCYIR